MEGTVPDFNYERLSHGAKRQIAALALKKGWSIEQVLEEVGIEFVAMGGIAKIGKPKARLYQLIPNEGLKSDNH
jgi:hypothetical protein